MVAEQRVLAREAKALGCGPDCAPGKSAAREVASSLLPDAGFTVVIPAE
jgi:hypothetical protein